jgi:hypothetical protein
LAIGPDERLVSTIFEGVGCWLAHYHDTLSGLHDVVVSAAAIVAGVWVIFRLWRERSNQAALTIGFASSSIPCESMHIAFLNVTLTNVGRSMIRAKVKKVNSRAYGDKDERIEYAGSLQLRKLQPPIPADAAELNWFKSPAAFHEIPHVATVNLLSDYENPDRDNRLEFWMEPGESYSLGRHVVLSPGLYVAKITFIGAGADTNFWTRIVQFVLPQPVP